MGVLIGAKKVPDDHRLRLENPNTQYLCKVYWVAEMKTTVVSDEWLSSWQEMKRTLIVNQPNEAKAY